MPNLRWLRIPKELRQRRQWAVATLALKPDGKRDKAPLNPITRHRISVTDPSSFSTFEECLNSGYPALGYILTADDPYTIIDLDSKPDTPIEDLRAQEAIFRTFQTYSERSQSGLGLHIIARGRIGGGRRRGAIEVYDQERFIICTGDVAGDLPIVDMQPYLEQLVLEMGGATTSAADLPPSADELYSDVEILEKASRAKNADKFKRLYYGGYQPGDDKSQVDASLAQIIAFYTRNHEQALRLWRGSALYRPHEKGKNPEHYEQYYLLERTFSRAWRAEATRDADVEVGRQLAERLIANAVAKENTKIAPSRPVVFPPGLVGDIASFILGASIRPVPEIALAGAITFCSGLLGRQYNISNTGLNLYTVLVAETGRGKEGAASGVDALVTVLRQNMPIIDSYQGPGHIASGQALIRRIDDHPSMFAFLSEFGHMLKLVTDPRASASDVRTRQVLLDLFSKSGQRQSLKSSVYSDSEKNTKTVQAPCFAFMGDTTPESYYSAFTSNLVSEGLLPRFLTITYDGPRVPKNDHTNVSPHPRLVERLTSVVTSVASMYHSSTFVDVRISEGAQRLLDQFDTFCDFQINSGSGTMVEMWNRAHLKVLRLAGLVAVGQDHFEPVVSPEVAQWAIDLVTEEITRLFVRVDAGDVGDGETRQLPTVVRLVKEYYGKTPDARIKAYEVHPNMVEYVPYSYFNRRMRMLAEFRNDRRGLSNAIRSAIQEAIELEYLQEIADQQKALIQGARVSTKLYCLGPSFPK